MESRELSRGSIVSYNGCIVEVISIFDSGLVNIKYNNGTCSHIQVDQLNPVQVTDEIMRALGFVKRKHYRKVHSGVSKYNWSLSDMFQLRIQRQEYYPYEMVPVFYHSDSRSSRSLDELHLLQRYISLQYWYEINYMELLSDIDLKKELVS